MHTIVQVFQSFLLVLFILFVISVGLVVIICPFLSLLVVSLFAVLVAIIQLLDLFLRFKKPVRGMLIHFAVKVVDSGWDGLHELVIGKRVQPLSSLYFLFFILHLVHEVHSLVFSEVCYPFSLNFIFLSHRFDTL